MSTLVKDAGVWKEPEMLYVKDDDVWKEVGGSGGGSRGSVLYRTSGSHVFVVPEGVFSVSAVCIGTGGRGQGLASGAPRGGGGGALAWGNNIPVTPGEVIEVVVSPANNIGNTDGSASRFGNFVIAGGGLAGSNGGQGGVGSGTHRQGGGNGGNGGSSTGRSGGGGGAGGYTSHGGDGGSAGAGAAGSGGSAGGGDSIASGHAGAGGGVGVYGLGQNGAAGGGGGSGGTDGASAGAISSNGGRYGGGVGARIGSTSLLGSASAGVVRVVWGEGRAFPDNDVGED